MSKSWSLLVALFFVAVAGGGMMAQIAATNTYVQTHVEDRMRSRVISYYVMAFQGMLPIGNLLTGTIAHQLGAKHTGDNAEHCRCRMRRVICILYQVCQTGYPT